MIPAEQQRLIPEERIITPLVEVLNEATPKPVSEPPTPGPVTKTLEQSLDELFPEQKHEQKDIQKAKETLGSLAAEFSPEQLKDTIVEIKYLCESWLDEFERQIFKGKTLAELLHEKGGL